MAISLELEFEFELVLNNVAQCKGEALTSVGLEFFQLTSA